MKKETRCNLYISDKIHVKHLMLNTNMNVIQRFEETKKIKLMIFYLFIYSLCKKNSNPGDLMYAPETI